jgi:hypothetical protein
LQAKCNSQEYSLLSAKSTIKIQIKLILKRILYIISISDGEEESISVLIMLHTFPTHFGGIRNAYKIFISVCLLTISILNYLSTGIKINQSEKRSLYWSRQ